MREWIKPSYKAQQRGEENKADKWTGGKITSRNVQACKSASPRGRSRKDENGENGYNVFCSAANDPHDLGIDDDDSYKTGVG